MDKDNEDLKANILKTLESFQKGELDYYAEITENGTNLMIYTYSDAGVKKTNLKEWCKKMGVRESIVIPRQIAMYRKLGRLKEEEEK